MKTRLGDGLGEYSSQAYQRYYCHPCESNPQEERKLHNILHTTRASLIATSLANLRVLHGEDVGKDLVDNLGLEDTESNRKLAMKLCQIYLIFHDSARKGEGEDLWDRDSAVNFYNFMVNDVDREGKFSDEQYRELIRKVAEFGANKDLDGGKYYYKLSAEKGELSWGKVQVGDEYKDNMVQRIIHDGDCMDIIRCRDNFRKSELSFYKDHKGNLQAMNDLDNLIEQHSLLIKLQEKKATFFNNTECLERVEKSILDVGDDCDIIDFLYNDSELSDKKELQKIYDNHLPLIYLTDYFEQEDLKEQPFTIQGEEGGEICLCQSCKRYR